MTEADPSSAARRGLRLLPLLLVGGLVSFIVGTRSVVTRPAHPLTGRPIPGIATDTTWMDRAERGREEEPDRALRSAGIVPGMTVADVGAGSGYMTIRIARLVGPTGKVFANELQPRMVQLIRERIARERLESRRNSNVRSLALSLGRKRVVTVQCEEHLRALEEALQQHEFRATR